MKESIRMDDCEVGEHLRLFLRVVALVHLLSKQGLSVVAEVNKVAQTLLERLKCCRFTVGLNSDVHFGF